MKHYQPLLIIIYYLITTFTCNAMKTSNILHQFEEITSVKNPIYVRFLSNDSITIDNQKNTYSVNLKTKQSQIIRTRPELYCPEKEGFSCQYNSDKSYIAKGYANKDKDKIILTNQNKKTDPFSIICLQANEDFRAITFHPNNSILAILCNRTMETLSRRSACKKQCVRYYNVKTLQCIDQTIEFDALYSYNLAFSPDGFTLIIVLEDKCVKLPVSFAIKEKCIHSLCALNQLKNKNGLILPKDVIRYIIEILCNNIIFG